ncbi:hypothetical protein C8R45DRAFT_615074 [Mycena sanguinolenta]|nr:hypothetical protein C8R45DRAFT_615074 [Mycena sanguinolenta]
MLRHLTQRLRFMINVFGSTSHPAVFENIHELYHATNDISSFLKLSNRSKKAPLFSSFKFSDCSFAYFPPSSSTFLFFICYFNTLKCISTFNHILLNPQILRLFIRIPFSLTYSLATSLVRFYVVGGRAGVFLWAGPPWRATSLWHPPCD